MCTHYQVISLKALEHLPKVEQVLGASWLEYKTSFNNAHSRAFTVLIELFNLGDLQV